jgi:hypothetical protein
MGNGCTTVQSGDQSQSVLDCCIAVIQGVVYPDPPRREATEVDEVHQPWDMKYKEMAELGNQWSIQASDIGIGREGVRAEAADNRVQKVNAADELVTVREGGALQNPVISRVIGSSYSGTSTRKPH